MLHIHSFFSPDTSLPIVGATVYSPQRDKLAKQSFKFDMSLSFAFMAEIDSSANIRTHNHE